jgi:hypothetical protein
VSVTLNAQLAPAASDAPQVFVWEKLPVVVMARVRAAVPVLETVTVWGALVVPRACPAKVRLEGETVSAIANPVPVSATVWVLGLALSERVRLPVRAPLAVGLNVTLMVQAAPAARDLPQVFVWEKSPLVVMLEMASASALVLVRVTACGTLLVLTT